jgi:hypothetical protein
MVMTIKVTFSSIQVSLSSVQLRSKRYLSRSQARRYRIAAAKKAIVATVKMASFTRERIERACLGSAERWIRISLAHGKGEVLKQ